ncbi:phosphoesterase [Halobacteriales archaeon QS_5_70_15]|nr:MAG: phosphoesterase [Halobacteriales archaeon QS_5_70_15]
MSTYSLNAPVPARVARLAAGLAGELRTADVRTKHSMVVKRLPADAGRAGGGPNVRAFAARAREVLDGFGPFAARVTGVESFDRPTSGTGPVVYLAVESPGLREAHRRLCGAFEPLPGLEGGDYVPHVTVARRGDARRLVGREGDPVEWTVERLVVWDAHRRLEVETVSLPP